MGALLGIISFTALIISALSIAIPSNSSRLLWAYLVISAPSNGRYLYRNISNEPFFWVADTNWKLFHRLNETEVDLYLADCAAKGFNVITAVLLSKYIVTTIPNFYGDSAINNGYVTWPNEDYFAYVDWIEPQLALSENASWHEGIHLLGAKQSGYVAKPFADLSKDEFNSMEPDRNFIGSVEGDEDVLGFESNRYVAGLVTKGHYWVYTGYGNPFVLDLSDLAEH